MKYAILVGAYLMTAALAFAAPMSSAIDGEEVDQSCRIKAKEIAAETYRTCVADNKNAQIEQIRTDYQDKLKKLKAIYDKKLKKIAGEKLAKAKNVEKSETKKAAQDTESVEFVGTPTIENTDGSSVDGLEQ